MSIVPIMLITLMFFAGSVLPGGISQAQAAMQVNDDPGIPVFIDEEEITEGLLPRLRNGRLLGPVRNISETLGAYVDYSEADQEAIIIKDDTEVRMQVDSDVARTYSPGEEVPEKTQLDAPMFIDEGRSFVPLRFLAENFGYYVIWDESSRTVSLVSPDQDEDEEIADEPEEVDEDQKEKDQEEDEEKDQQEPEQPEEKDEEDEKETEVEPNDEEDKIKDIQEQIDARTEELDLQVKFEDKKIDIITERAGTDFPQHEVDFSKNEEQFIITVKNSKIEDKNWDFDNQLLDKLSATTVVTEQKVEEVMEDTVIEEDENTEIGDTVSTYKGKITVELNYPVPELDPDISKNDGESTSLIVTIPKVFETILEEQEIANGLKYTSIRKGQENGPIKIHELRLDPHGDVKPELIMAQDGFSGFERLDSMAKRNNAIAAINGGFYWRAGHPIGLYISDQRLIREPMPNRSAFFYSKDGEATIERTAFNGGLMYIDDINTNLSIDGVNRSRGREELIVYTPEQGNTTGTTSSTFRGHKEIVISDEEIIAINHGDSQIPDDGYVLSIHEQYVRANQDLIDELETGMTTKLHWNMGQSKNVEDVVFALGGGPRILEKGEVDIRSMEEVISDNVSQGRSPRTAVGVTRDGQLLLTAVDGRQSGLSIGMTLEELGNFMKDRGAQDALNLDGGGSTMMWFDNEFQNNPSNGIRNIGNSIVIREK